MINTVIPAGFAERMAIALAEIVAVPDESKRLFHGRGHSVPEFNFINIDWYAPLILITLYQSVSDRLLESIVAQLQRSFALGGIQLSCIYAQSRYQKPVGGEVLWGDLPDELFARESGLSFQLSIGQAQNIGFFPDMRPGRRWLAERARGKKILNLFAYTCSFSVVAIDAGARNVINIDMSRGSLNRGRRNHQLNGQESSLQRDVTFLAHDIFRSWGKLKKFGPYDIVIVDPPSLQKGSFVADKDYAKLVRKLEPMLAAEAEILFCLNAPHLDESFLHEVIAANSSKLECVGRIASDRDFPEADASRNLKMLHYRSCVIT